MAVHLRREGAALSLTVGEPARDDDPTRYIAALEEIAGTACPFVLLVAFERPLELAHDQRKAQNLWFKTTRRAMNAACRAAAIVRQEPSEDMQRVFAGLWDFPVLVTDSTVEADAFLAGHLPDETAS